MESQCDGLCNAPIDIPEIKVTFENGEEDRFVLKHSRFCSHNNKRCCAYGGHLEKEKDTSNVAVTGCADKENPDGIMDITLLSTRHKCGGLKCSGVIFLDFDDNTISQLNNWLKEDKW